MARARSSARRRAAWSSGDFGTRAWAAVNSCRAAWASICSAAIARGVSTVTTSDRTWANPPSTNTRWAAPRCWYRSSPGPSRPMSGARPGSTPSSPSYIGSATNSAGSSITAFSGVTTTHCSFLPLVDSTQGPRRNPPRSRLHLLADLDRLVDPADVHERLLGQRVVLAVADLLERPDRLGERRDVALLAGERLGHQERL